MKRHGGLRAVRRHPVARLCTLFALLTYVLVGIAPLWVPALQRDGIEICTANGLRILPADFPDPASRPGNQKSKTACPLCAIQGAALLAPADCALEASGHDHPAFAQPESGRDTTGLFAGFDHFSRAPPRLA